MVRVINLVVERGFTHLVVECCVTVECGGVWDGESDSPGSRTWFHSPGSRMLCNC